MKVSFDFRKFIRVFSIALILLLTALTITNPGESKYLKRISNDYSQIHEGMQFSEDDLLRMGAGHRTTYGIFSHYEYSFGNIKVEYIGVAGSVYYLGSDQTEGGREIEEPSVIT